MFPVDPPADDQVPQGPLPEPSPETPIIAAEKLFGSQREIWIELGGIRYRLRITRRNRLILQK